VSSGSVAAAALAAKLTACDTALMLRVALRSRRRHFVLASFAFCDKNRFTGFPSALRVIVSNGANLSSVAMTTSASWSVKRSVDVAGAENKLDERSSVSKSSYS